jgi:hypothetical protein
MSTNIIEGGVIPFFKSLLPNFEKNRMISDLESAFKEMKTTQEMYNVPSRDYMGVMNNQLSSVERAFRKGVHGYKGDVMQYIAMTISARLGDKDDLIAYVDSTYGPDVMKDVFDYQKVNLLRYVEGLSFFNTYARKLILVATNYRINDTTVLSAVDKMDIAYVLDVNNIKAFTVLISAMSRSVSKLKADLSKMATVGFKPEMHDLVVRQHGQDTDPLTLGFIPLIGSISYRVGLAINLYLARRQELAREEAEKLKLTVLLTRRKMESINDPAEEAKLQKQIDYYNNRISKLSGKLEDMAAGA